MNPIYAHDSKWMRHNGRLSEALKHAVFGIVLGAVAALGNLQASLIFEADFNGAGGGTGGSGDLVSYGGTGSTYQYTTATTSVTNSLPMGGGYYLNVAAGAAPTSGLLGGVHFTPTSAANSWAATQTITNSTLYLHTAQDFFFTPVAGDVTNTSYLYSTFGAFTGGGIKLYLQNLNANTVRLQIRSSAVGAFGDSGSDSVYLSYTTAGNVFTLGSTYHIAFSLVTDVGTGVTTANLWDIAGTGAIDTALTTPSASATFTINSSIVTTGFSSSAWDINMGTSNGNASYANDETAVDTYRLYDSLPATFGAIPEPTSFALLVGGALVLVSSHKRRSGRLG